MSATFGCEIDARPSGMSTSVTFLGIGSVTIEQLLPEHAGASQRAIAWSCLATSLSVFSRSSDFGSAPDEPLRLPRITSPVGRSFAFEHTKYLQPEPAIENVVAICREGGYFRSAKLFPEVRRTFKAELAHYVDLQEREALRRSSSGPYLAHARIRKAIALYSSRQERFNSDGGPPSAGTLCGWLESDGLHVEDISRLPLLYARTGSAKGDAVYFSGEQLHPAVIAILLGRALGEGALMLLVDGLSEHDADSLTAPSHPLSLSAEAESIAMVALLPSPYLAWLDARGALTLANVYEALLAAHPSRNAPPPAQEAVIMRACRRRIQSYRVFKRYLHTEVHQLFLPPNCPLDQRAVPGFTRALSSIGKAWAWVDASNHLIDWSDRWRELAIPDGDAQTDLSGVPIGNFSCPEDRETQHAYHQLRRATLSSTLYFTRYAAMGGVRGALLSVYALPVVTDKGEYAGSLGLVAPTQQDASLGEAVSGEVELSVDEVGRRVFLSFAAPPAADPVGPGGALLNPFDLESPVAFVDASGVGARLTEFAICAERSFDGSLQALEVLESPSEAEIDELVGRHPEAELLTYNARSLSELAGVCGIAMPVRGAVRGSPGREV